jgi:hypothetical protein
MHMKHQIETIQRLKKNESSKNILERARKDVEANQMNNPHQQLKRQKTGLGVVKGEKG